MSTVTLSVVTTALCSLAVPLRYWLVHALHVQSNVHTLYFCGIIRGAMGYSQNPPQWPLVKLLRLTALLRSLLDCLPMSAAKLKSQGKLQKLPTSLADGKCRGEFNSEVTVVQSLLFPELHITASIRRFDRTERARAEDLSTCERLNKQGVLHSKLYPTLNGTNRNQSWSNWC